MVSTDIIGNAHSVTLNKPWEEFAHDKPAITYLEETKRMGTAGALGLLQDIPTQPLFVVSTHLSRRFVARCAGRLG